MNVKILQKCLPKATPDNIAKYGEKLIAAMKEYDIVGQTREAAFIAQVGHESASLNAVSENLNYSAQGLMKIFGKYFTEETAKAFERKPEAIANIVYANRYGNGDIESGDGWNYRGRGLFQLTFKDNYEEVSHALKFDFVKQPEKLELPGPACYSSAWFWNDRGLNRLADIEAFEKITKKINGGLNGYEDRLELWEHCKEVLYKNIDSPKPIGH